MEAEQARLGYRKPPLPARRSKQVDSQDTSAGSPQDEPRVQARHNRPSVFPPIHLKRFNSLNRIDTDGNTSIDKEHYRSRQRTPTNVSLRSLPRSSRSINSRQSSKNSIDSLVMDQTRTPPQVSAHSWIAYQMNRGKFIHGKRIHKKRQIASLTKIMNLITAIDTLERLKLNPEKIMIRVSKETSGIQGTTAFLKEGMQLSLYDLMFGMMLPSGNDAAYAMAQTIGALISEMEDLSQGLVYNVDRLTQLYTKKKKPALFFMNQMNQLARNLSMYSSKFTNAHGLSQITNVSTADDLSKLCSYSLKNKLFFKVVNTKEYRLQYTLPTEPEVEPEVFHIVWQNTNKMLWEGWNGVKTGVTPNAGPCLAASVQKNVNGVPYHILVILICASSMDVRWKQVQQIANWIVSQGIY